MPVSTENSISGPYTPNGVTTDFAFDFKATAANEVVALDQDGETISAALYSVMLDDDEGGTLSFSVAPVLADYSQIFIAGNPALTQPSDFDNAGPSFNPAALTRALDRAAARDLRQQREIDRGLKVAFGESAPALPALADRKGKFLGFSSVDGSPVATEGSDSTIGPDLASTDEDKGAALVGYKAPGIGAVLRTAEDALRDIPTRAGYSTTAASIAAAVADDFVVGVTENLTVNIPSDAATLQIALDRLTPLNRQCTITLNIESGHTLTAGVNLSGGDYSQFRIVSEDAEVPIAFSGNVFTGTDGAKMPRLSCLIDAMAQITGNGISLNRSSMDIDPGCGVKNVWGTGLATINNCSVGANGAEGNLTNFSGAARNGTTGAGITAWGSQVSAEYCDCTNSGYYGAQAAHGGRLAFRYSDASDATRHGIRASDVAVVDADSAVANRCGSDGFGSNLRAFEGGVINFTNGTAIDNLANASTGLANGAALFAYGAGAAINAPGATITGAARVGVWAERGATITTVGGTVSGNGVANFVIVDATIVNEKIGGTSGTYTPVINDTFNLTGTPSATAQWSRVGNIITVSGLVTGVAPTASGNTRFDMSLPIPGNIAGVGELGGAGVFYSASLRSVAAGIYGDITDEKATFNWNSPVSGSGQSMSFTFQYFYRAP
ncbi:hypothetical protein [Qipengyuania pacifica]|uniref:hypothetical protein n=1 Tax=Qipengyuania pacifica TaxID=2860199 RepID=UPI001C9DB38F|nr:hypothetical protein [Qipengyuania pacifica]MBY8333108.1 hypothetical protein [Qipengyuania pacifica]